MHAVELVFGIGWAAFWIYWIVAAFSMKRGHVSWSRELRIRAVVFVGAIVLVRFGAFKHDGLNSDPWRATGAGDERPLSPGTPPHLLWHPARWRGHGGSTELDMAHRPGSGRGLLHLQRDRRGALPDRAVPRYLPEVQEFDQDAGPLHLLRCSQVAHPGDCHPQGT